MASSMQAVAHGANSVQYFQFRKSRGSTEKFHGAVVDHYGGSDDPGSGTWRRWASGWRPSTP